MENRQRKEGGQEAKSGGGRIGNTGVKTVLFVAFIIMVMLWVVLNSGKAWGAVTFVLGLLTPFILGLCFAFILNVPLRFIEIRLFGRIADRLVEGGRARRTVMRVKRPVSLLLTLIIVFGILVFVLANIVPELRNTIESLITVIPQHAGELKQASADLSRTLGINVDLYDLIVKNWKEIGLKILDLLAGGETDFAAAALGVTKQVFSGLANAVIGLVFAIYILLLKDRLSGQTRAFIAAHFKEKTSLKIFRVTHLASRTFAGFVRGQFFEGVIVAVLVFIGMLIINASYAVMFAVLLGICAFIPVIGSIIGTIAAAVVLLAVNPWEALAFVIFIIVMQQIESNVIYPRVVGSIISLPGIWVLLAVVAGAAFSGIVGVVVCVPLIALIYSLVRDNVRDRLEEKGVSAEKIDELVAQSHEQIKIFEREPHNKE